MNSKSNKKENDYIFNNRIINPEKENGNNVS